MRIAFCLFKYFPFGGLQRDFYSIATECIARGHTVDVYTLEWQGDKPPQFKIHIIPVTALTNHRRYWLFGKKIQERLNQTPCDLVVGFNKIPGLDVYYAADPCYLAKMAKTRSFWSYLTLRHRYFAKLEQSVLGPESMSKILHLTGKQKQDIQHYYSTVSERFYLLPINIAKDRIPAFDQDQIRLALRQELKIPDEDYLLLMIGSGFKTKGLDRALAAVASLEEQERKRVHFIVIGQDNPQPFLRLAHQLGIEQQLTIYPGRTDVQRFFLAADLLIHPAYSESAGIVIIEALVAGLPVLVTQCCGYAEHVSHAQAGLLVPEPFKQSVLNQYLKKMLEVPQRAKWSNNARAYTSGQNFFTMPQKVVDEFEQYSTQRLHCFSVEPLINLRDDLHKKWVNANNSADLFNDIMSSQGEVYRAIATRKTLRFEYNNKAYFIKLHWGVGIKEIIKNLIQCRLPILGAKNEWRAIQRLQDLQIDTMTLAGFGMQGKNPVSLQSFVITAALPKAITLEDLCRQWRQSPPSFKLKLALLKKVASIAQRLHDNGLNHRDFYLCHFLLRTEFNLEMADITLYLIDLHRVQIRNKLPLRWRVKDIGGLYFSAMEIGLTQRDLLRFMRYYQQTDLRKIVKENDSFWQAVQTNAKKLFYKAFQRYPQLPKEIKSCEVIGG